MNLVQIETFLCVARLGSFRAAAQRLGTTQPCISQRVRELETSLGSELFDRSSRRQVRLTARGRALVPDAERFLLAGAELRRRFSSVKALRGIVRLGVTGTIAVNWLPKLIDALAQDAAGVEIEFVADLSANLSRLLAEGRLDLAFFAGAPPQSGFVGEIVGRVPLAWFCSPRLNVPAKVLQASELAAWPLITDVPGTSFHRLSAGWFEKAGVRPARNHACSSLATRIQLAEAGLGIALIPLTALSDELDDGRLRRVDVEPALPDLEHVLAYPSSPLEAPVRKVIEMIKRQLAFEPNFRFSSVSRRARPLGQAPSAKRQAELRG